MKEIEPMTIDHGDPRDWDELPDGFGAIIARYLEDNGWHVVGQDATVVNVLAQDGSETGVWHSGSGRVWTGISEHGHCDNPIQVNVDVTDPEAIAWGADQEMRRLGLKPGKPEA
jgi:hypothetical protein